MPDDGTAETGYGWVPSVVEGEYVQLIDGTALSSHQLASVCVCWLRTRPDDSIDFEVVVYPEVLDLSDPDAPRRRPDDQPFAVFAARAEGVPEGITGRFYEVGTGNVDLPPGNLYVGARWDASVDQFFFVCVDTTKSTPPVGAFFRDDRSDEHAWTSVFETRDPIFRQHHAIMIRGVAGPALIPTMTSYGNCLLALCLGVLGLTALGHRPAEARGRQ